MIFHEGRGTQPCPFSFASFPLFAPLHLPPYKCPMPELSRLEISGLVARLTLNRPDVRNALSIDLLNSLIDQIEPLRQREDLNVLILCGEGKSFCAGMDLKAVLDSPGDSHKLLFLLADFTLRFRSLPFVTVARVQGAAIGGGCGVACVADICLSHADAKLGFPEVDMGVCPAVVAPWLVKKIGAGPARRVLLTGGLMSGAQAHHIGIVDILTPDLAALGPACDDLSKRLSGAGGFALRRTKELLNTIDGSLDQSLVLEGAKLSARVVQSPEAQALLRAKLSG